MTNAQKWGLGIALAIFGYWMFSGAYWTPYTEWDFKNECEDQGQGLPCQCILDYMKLSGYTPNDLDGDNYERGALGSALACL